MTTTKKKFKIEARPMHNRLTVYEIIKINEPIIKDGIKYNMDELTGIEFTDEKRAISKMALMEVIY